MKQMMSNYEKQVDIGKSYFLKYDQQLLAEKFHLETDEQYLYLTYIGTRCRIARSTGTIYEKTSGEYTECRSYAMETGRSFRLSVGNGRWWRISRRREQAPVQTFLHRNTLIILREKRKY